MIYKIIDNVIPYTDIGVVPIIDDIRTDNFQSDRISLLLSKQSTAMCKKEKKSTIKFYKWTIKGVEVIRLI